MLNPIFSILGKRQIKKSVKMRESLGSPKPKPDENVGAKDTDVAIDDNMDTLSDETTEMTKQMRHLYETLLKHIDPERNEILIGKSNF